MNKAQTIFIFLIMVYDFYFLINQYQHHVTLGHLKASKELYIPIFGIGGYRILMPTETIVMYAHILTAFIPLVWSLVQCWDVARGWSMKLHRTMGKLVVAASIISFFPAFKLAFQTRDNGPLEKFWVAVYCLLWIVSVLQTYRYAVAMTRGPQAKRNAAYKSHMEWSVRFTTYTHGVPLIMRIIGLFVWMYLGSPDWHLSGVNATTGKAYPAASSSPYIYPLSVLPTAIPTLLLGELLAGGGVLGKWGAIFFDPTKKSPNDEYKRD